MKSFASIFVLFFVTVSLLAQTDTAKVKVRNKFAPTGVRVGTDLISIVRNYSDDTFNGWEVNADVDFSRYYFILDYGSTTRTFVSGDSLNYTSEGNYFRTGVDVNFLTKDPDRNMFFLGLRYGRATFSERYSFTEKDLVWGIDQRTLTNSNINGRWLELTTGIKVKIWKVIWMGYTAGFKFGLKTNQTGVLAPTEVPGYGRADEESYWGFNYQIFIRIPVRKQPSITQNKK